MKNNGIVLMAALIGATQLWAAAPVRAKEDSFALPFRLSVPSRIIAPQTAPAFGGGAAGGADAGGEEKTFRILIVKHVYAGGIAALFKEAGLIPTAPFVSPGSRNSGGQGGRGGQGGGFGGQQGGGGFGGQQGGGGFGGGGFGGGGGGFGGGGFGGGGGGFGRRF